MFVWKENFGIKEAENWDVIGSPKTFPSLCSSVCGFTAGRRHVSEELG